MAVEAEEEKPCGPSRPPRSRFLNSENEMKRIIWFQSRQGRPSGKKKMQVCVMSRLLFLLVFFQESRKPIARSISGPPREN